MLIISLNKVIIVSTIYDLTGVKLWCTYTSEWISISGCKGGIHTYNTCCWRHEAKVQL